MYLKKLICLGIGLMTLHGLKAQDSTAAVEPGWFLIPNTQTKLKIGGYVKFDLIHDLDPIGSPDFFDVTKIPTDGSEGASTHLNAKESRLHLDARTQVNGTKIRAYFEGDFYGSGGAFRMRHAFVEVGERWMAGQWWSNFMDETIIPPTLDFEKPGAYAFARNPMLRFKPLITKSSYIALAVEVPTETGQAPADTGAFYSPYPDFNARYRLTKEWGHIQLTGFVGYITYELDAGGSQSATLYGANLSGQLNLFKADKIIYQALYGPGVGRYRGGLSVGLDKNGKIEPIVDEGFTLGYQHQWVPKFTSLVVYNHGFNYNTDGQPGNSFNRTNYFAANLIWHFMPNAFAGIEYLYGTRTNKDGADGEANRFQFSMKYSFN